MWFLWIIAGQPTPPQRTPPQKSGFNKALLGKPMVNSPNISTSWEAQSHIYASASMLRSAVSFCCASLMSQQNLDQKSKWCVASGELPCTDFVSGWCYSTCMMYVYDAYELIWQPDVWLKTQLQILMEAEKDGFECQDFPFCMSSISLVKWVAVGLSQVYSESWHAWRSFSTTCVFALHTWSWEYASSKGLDTNSLRFHGGSGELCHAVYQFIRPLAELDEANRRWVPFRNSSQNEYFSFNLCLWYIHQIL